jgi:hypothetical protein
MDLECAVVGVDLVKQDAVLLVPWSEDFEAKSTRFVLQTTIAVG